MFRVKTKNEKFQHIVHNMSCIINYNFLVYSVHTSILMQKYISIKLITIYCKIFATIIIWHLQAIQHKGTVRHIPVRTSLL